MNLSSMFPSVEMRIARDDVKRLRGSGSVPFHRFRPALDPRAELGKKIPGERLRRGHPPLLELAREDAEERVLRRPPLMKDKERFAIPHPEAAPLAPHGAEGRADLLLEVEVPLVRSVRLVPEKHRRPLLVRHRRRAGIGKEIAAGDLVRPEEKRVEPRLVDENAFALLEIGDRAAPETHGAVAVGTRPVIR
jgi:hypothetical protein